jgi:hypothetical protein
VIARAVRVALAAAGAAIAGYGLWLLSHRQSELVGVVGWLAGGVLAHDAVIAPLTIVISAIGLRLLPARARGPVTAGFVVLGTVTLTAIPVLLSLGARPDNLTLLDRHYGVGWLVLAAVVSAGVALTMAVRHGEARARADPSEDEAGRET